MKVFNEIDAYFDKKDKKEFYYALVGVVVLIGFLFIYYLYPIATSYQEKNYKHFQKLTKDLSNEKYQLNLKIAENNRLNNELKLKTNELVSLKKQESFYYQLVSVLDFATFNRYKWANFIKNIINDASNEGLKVLSIDNQFVNELNASDLIVQHLTIDVKLKGRYKNFIHYIYQYEKLKDLIRVSKMNINSNDTYEVKLNIYGYKK